MTTLVVDNYDSFTWNLVQLVGAMGEECVVRRNDEITLAGVRALTPSRIIMSPGPGHPSDPKRIGVCADILAAEDFARPILGVCLGHQAIVEVLGGAVVRAPRLMHGKASYVRHDGRGLFEGVPQSFAAGRYHSLIAERERLPAELEVTAWTEEGEIMGVRHRGLGIEGVQFHPESVLTPEGPRLLAAFLGADGHA